LKLILASSSPRRRELLTQAGFVFDVVAADIDESERVGESAANYVRRLAEEKARVVAGAHPEAVVLGADTTVVLDGEIMQKPVDAADAERMLRKLSGRTHQVHTGLAVVRGGVCESHVETTDVVFREIAEDELRVYVASGHAMDKAGAYGIQGYAARWIPRIEGDYFNVVGLPLSAVVGMLNCSE
jgi:septum formation protein